MSTLLAFLCLGFCLCCAHQVAKDDIAPSGSFEEALMKMVLNQAVELRQQSTQGKHLEEELRRMGTKVKSLEGQQLSINASLKDQHPAEVFRASLVNPVVANAHIRFHPDFIKGQGRLNPHTGVYTVATPGVYLLGFQLFPTFFGHLNVDLIINGARGIRIGCGQSARHDSCHSSILFDLQKGDTVWLQSEVGGTFWGGYHSYIFGILILPGP